MRSLWYVLNILLLCGYFTSPGWCEAKGSKQKRSSVVSYSSSELKGQYTINYKCKLQSKTSNKRDTIEIFDNEYLICGHDGTDGCNDGAVVYSYKNNAFYECNSSGLNQWNTILKEDLPDFELANFIKTACNGKPGMHKKTRIFTCYKDIKCATSDGLENVPLFYGFVDDMQPVLGCISGTGYVDLECVCKDQEHKVDKTQIATSGSSSDFKETQKEAQFKIAGTCDYQRGDGVKLGDYYLSKGRDVIPCNVPNNDKTCVTDDIVIPVNTPMVCDSKGWQPLDITSLDENCNENKFVAYQSINTDKAVFYYKTVKDSAKITDLYGCAKRSHSQIESHSPTDETLKGQICKIGGDNYTVGKDKKPNTNYVVCKSDNDCNNATLPSATKLRCSGAKGDICGSCVAEQCKNNFTVKHVDGQSFGFCISNAEQNCINAVGDKKWNSKTKKCDCGEKTWDNVTNTCTEDDEEIETQEEEKTVNDASNVCTDSDGTLNDQGECAQKEEHQEDYEEEEEEEGNPINQNDQDVKQKNDEEQTLEGETDTNRSPELEEKLQSAKDALAAAKEKENSWANRGLSAASTAATSLGAMQLAEGIAERKADTEAEKQMRDYITTMKCEYGGSQGAVLGNEEITLPGGNELLEYYTEYKSLADNLKTTKAALGLRTGIESETLYDRAQSGLYQYASTGKTGGGETSLFRALTDAESEDAAAWAEQKETASKKLNAGTAATVVGVGGGIVGNYLVNGRDKKDEKK